MIKSFRHRGLKRLYERDDPRRLNPEHVDTLKDILARLEAAEEPVTFRFDGQDVTDVDYEDYH